MTTDQHAQAADILRQELPAHMLRELTEILMHTPDIKTNPPSDIRQLIRIMLRHGDIELDDADFDKEWFTILEEAIRSK